MESALCLPYMGSKSKSAGKIYNLIKELNPESQVVCDLFCGGFAVSSTFLKQGWRVIANDRNKYVVSLIDNILNKNLDKNKCLEWVSRETFAKVRQSPGDYPGWYVGYVTTCWSFGNNQQNYLYGKKSESLKEAAHDLVVNQNFSQIIKLLPTLTIKDIENIIQQSSWNSRRLSFQSASAFHNLRLQHLECLNGLQRMEKLNKLKYIKLTSGSYDQVDIPAKAVIYCDPPYKDTKGYGDFFDHKEFWDWVRQKSKTYKVYVSEYTAPSDFRKILEFDRVSTLSATSNATKAKECIFVAAN